MVRVDSQPFDWLFERGDIVPWPNPIPHSLQEVVRDAVEALDRENRWLLEMKYYELCTYQEIAYRTGRGSAGAAFYHVNKALRKLKEEIIRRTNNNQ
jgi:DNA-directed RNA polymerase specialized sigma24 family protein